MLFDVINFALVLWFSWVFAAWRIDSFHFFCQKCAVCICAIKVNTCRVRSTCKTNLQTLFLEGDWVSWGGHRLLAPKSGIEGRDGELKAGEWRQEEVRSMLVP